MSKIKKEMVFSMSLMKRAAGYSFVPYFFISVLVTIVPVVQLYFLGVLLDMLLKENNFREIWPWLGLFILTILAMPVLKNLSAIFYRNIWEKENHMFDVLVEKKVVELPMTYLDSVEGRNRIDAMLNAKYYVCAFWFTISSIVSSLITCAVAAIQIGRYSSLGLLAFFVLSAIGAIFVNYSDTLIYAWNVKSAPDVRKFSYYRWMLTDFWPAKDVRMYNLSEPIKKRYDEEKKAYLAKKRKLTRKGLYLGSVSVVLAHVGFAFFLMMLIRDTLNQRITIGNFSYYAGTALIVIGLFEEIVSTVINTVFVANKRFADCWNFFEEPDESVSENSVERDSNEPFNTIEFVDVSFRYPYMEEYVLKGISFVLNAGEKISIVGVNGAGKTTIVKLMMGLYQPTSGKILFNGREYSQYDIREIRKQFAAIFQDFVTYPLLAEENVYLSDLSRKEDTAGVRDALRKSGILEKFDSLPGKEKTWITRQFSECGEELSGGERQKLALSRTYFKNSPILVFDEPSAALDAEAEEKVIEDYRNLSADKAAILISHRMSGVKIADRILVLEDGVIVEEGTHEELLNADGPYRQLYMVQKEKFSQF